MFVPWYPSWIKKPLLKTQCVCVGVLGFASIYVSRSRGCVLVTKRFGMGGGTWTFGFGVNGNWGGPRVLFGSNLGQMEEERGWNQPLGRQWMVFFRYSDQCHSCDDTGGLVWPLPTVLCLFSHGQVGLLPWVSSSNYHPYEARNLWSWEGTTWKPLPLILPYG